jgi:dTMP kinase
MAWSCGIRSAHDRTGRRWYHDPVAKQARRGKFISFEGLDGCGKSTQLEKLAGVIRGQGIDVVTTREPGGTAIGERIRAVLLDSRTADLDPYAEMALMFAARAQLIAEVIEPALAAGKWVLCDRFTDSTEAYQGGGRQLGREVVRQLHNVLCRGLWPDLTILMDSDLSFCVSRARRRNKSAEQDENRFERESRAFFTRVRDGFLEIARREPGRVVMIDARPSIEVVHGEIMRVVKDRF